MVVVKTVGWPEAVGQKARTLCLRGCAKLEVRFLMFNAVCKWRSHVYRPIYTHSSAKQ